MPAGILLPATLQPEGPRRKQWTRAECAQLEAIGSWNLEKLELVGGDLIDKMGKNRPHVKIGKLIEVLLAGLFGLEYVDWEAAIDVAPEDNPTNEPVPDLVVLKKPSWEFEANPRPGEIHLVVEVADSTLRFDLTVKAALYARAGIAEYWVVDVTGRRLVVHREPANGAYASIQGYGETESLAPLGMPGTAISVAAMFGPPSKA